MSYIGLMHTILLGIDFIPQQVLRKKDSTHLQATRSWRDMRCMHLPPARPCTCLPRTLCTCRRWAPCTRCCMRSLRWRRLLHSCAHRWCTHIHSHMQTRTREKISVYVYVGICLCIYIYSFAYVYKCIHLYMYVSMCLCVYVSMYVYDWGIYTYDMYT
jgi:hypothetical protein